MFLTAFLAVAAMSAAAFTASAATWVVAPQGSDANTGYSLQSAFKTPQRAVDMARPGDTVAIHPGTYNITSNPRGYLGILVSKSGTSTARIVIKGVDPANRPVINLSGLRAPINSNIRGMYISGAYITVSDVTFVGAGKWSSSAWGNGVEIEGGDNNIIRRVTAKDSNGVGIRVAGDARNNMLHNCDAINSYNRARAGEADGIQLVNMPSTATGNRVIGCRSWYGADDGIDLWGAQAPIYLENVVVARAGLVPGTMTPAGDGGLGTGIKLGESGVGATHKLVRSYACENNVSGINSNGAKGRLQLLHNLSFNNRNTEFGLIYGGPHYLRNNVAVPQRDVYKQPGYSQDDAYNGWTVQGITVDAGDFVNLNCSALLGPRTAAGDYSRDAVSLVAGSDLIDKGIDVGLPYSGAAPDLGPIEHAAPASGAVQ